LVVLLEKLWITEHKVFVAPQCGTKCSGNKNLNFFMALLHYALPNKASCYSAGVVNPFEMT
jgi:hypothetical protein